MGQPVLQDKEDPQVIQVLKAKLVQMASKDPLVPLELQVRQELRVLQDQLDREVLQVTLVPMVLLVLTVFQEQLEKLDLKAQKEFSDQLVNKERLVNKDQQGIPVNQALKAQPAKMELLVTLDQWALLVLLVQMAKLV